MRYFQLACSPNFWGERSSGSCDDDDEAIIECCSWIISPSKEEDGKKRFPHSEKGLLSDQVEALVSCGDVGVVIVMEGRRGRF